LNCKQIELRYQGMRDDLALAEGKSAAFGLLGDAEQRKGTHANGARSSIKRVLRYASLSSFRGCQIPSTMPNPES
jgi:hypothetical protein